MQVGFLPRNLGSDGRGFGPCRGTGLGVGRTWTRLDERPESAGSPIVRSHGSGAGAEVIFGFPPQGLLALTPTKPARAGNGPGRPPQQNRGNPRRGWPAVDMFDKGPFAPRQCSVIMCRAPN